jgi:hypothetical protein
MVDRCGHAHHRHTLRVPIPPVVAWLQLCWDSQASHDSAPCICLRCKLYGALHANCLYQLLQHTDDATVPWSLRYEGYDLVVWGQRERIEQGDLEGWYVVVVYESCEASELFAAKKGLSYTECLCSRPKSARHEFWQQPQPCGRFGAGINCGVMMFRNSDWSRAFLAQLSDYAHLGEEALLQMRPV